MRNFAKLTEKFHLTQRKFEGSSTKLHGELSSSFREIKGQNPASFASFFFLYSTVQLQEEECLIHADAFTSFIFCSL